MFFWHGTGLNFTLFSQLLRENQKLPEKLCEMTKWLRIWLSWLANAILGQKLKITVLADTFDEAEFNSLISLRLKQDIWTCVNWTSAWTARVNLLFQMGSGALLGILTNFLLWWKIFKSSFLDMGQDQILPIIHSFWRQIKNGQKSCVRCQNDLKFCLLIEKSFIGQKTVKHGPSGHFLMKRNSTC